MSERVAIVTDSTAYLPRRVVRTHGIRVVPLQVVHRRHVVRRGVRRQLGDGGRRAARLDPGQHLAAGPFAFLSVYEQAAEEGYTAAVSLHLSSDMSGTYESAVTGCPRLPDPCAGRRLAVAGDGRWASPSSRRPSLPLAEPPLTR